MIISHLCYDDDDDDDDDDDWWCWWWASFQLVRCYIISETESVFIYTKNHLEQKPAPVPVCPSQIPCRLLWIESKYLPPVSSFTCKFGLLHWHTTNLPLCAYPSKLHETLCAPRDLQTTVFQPVSYHRVVTWLTSWSRVQLEKLTLTQLDKKFPAFYRTWRFITVLTKALHWYSSWARWLQFRGPM